jgi:acid phosphatase family membrane protein YuiD
MIRLILYRDIFLLPLIAGVLNQFVKFIIYSILEKRVDIGRLIQPDGMPSIHGAVFGSLSMIIGVKYGYSSILYSVATVFSVIIIHDTMRFKRAKGKQVDMLNRLIADIEEYGYLRSERVMKVLQYRPLDVLSGVALGVALSYLLLN